MNPEMISPKLVKHNSWWRVLLIGIAFYIVSLILLILTGNSNLFPTVVLVGCFLIPITYVAFFYDRRLLSHLTLPAVAQGFVYGGLLGVLGASLLEPILVNNINPLSVFTIGLIEEGAKILGILVIARHHRHDSEMDGLILGAAAGMGFAALESNGYAFNAFLSSGGSLSTTVFVILLRGILSPIGHGTWTAILASILFRESHAGRYHINLKVIGAYLLVSLLHGLWDGVPSLLTSLFGSGFDVFVGEAVVGLAGLVLLWLRWREAKRLQIQAVINAEISNTPQQPPVQEN
jgi:RsiW-degrading membrane proteinase PrsW (M82 family)